MDIVNDKIQLPFIESIFADEADFMEENGLVDIPNHLYLFDNGECYYRQEFIQEMLKVSTSYIRDKVAKRELSGHLATGYYEVERTSLLRFVDQNMYEGNTKIFKVAHVYLPLMWDVQTVASFYSWLFPNTGWKQVSMRQTISRLVRQLNLLHYDIGGVKFTKEQWLAAFHNPLLYVKERGRPNLAVFMLAGPFVDEKFRTQVIKHLEEIKENDGRRKGIETYIGQLEQLISFYESRLTFSDIVKIEKKQGRQRDNFLA